jgi:hypothetical protein
MSWKDHLGFSEPQEHQYCNRTLKHSRGHPPEGWPRKCEGEKALRDAFDLLPFYWHVLFHDMGWATASGINTMK